MDNRTVSYLSGRFSDYYRNADFSPPPDKHKREFGLQPWSAPNTFDRHKPLYELGEPIHLALAEEEPQHTYYSAALYEFPSNENMSEKNWLGCDLVFDIDGDHLPHIDVETASHKQIIEASKPELLNLLDILEKDFDIQDYTVFFSGGRGFHVHVYDEQYRQLSGNARDSIVKHVNGQSVDIESIVDSATSEGTNYEHVLGGWGNRLHMYAISKFKDIQSMEEAEAIRTLKSIDGVGDKYAEKTFNVLKDGISGQILVGDIPTSMKKVYKHYLEEGVEELSADIDQPVTNDVRRLVRLPYTLHGGTGFVVTPLEKEEVEDFNPFTDAIPENFEQTTSKISVEEETTLNYGNEHITLEEGVNELPEYKTIYALCTGVGEKVKE